MDKQKLMIAAGVVALIGIWGIQSIQAQPAQVQMKGFKRVMLQQHDLGAPGREVVQARGELEQAGSVGKHTHPGEEVGYVLEGTFEFEVEGKPPTTLKAGDSFFVPAGTVHAGKNVGKTPAKVLSTYIVEKGKPLAAPAK
jgi:quercetin dioxygenase-like cupin family protein